MFLDINKIFTIYDTLVRSLMRNRGIDSVNSHLFRLRVILRNFFES